MKKKLKQFGAWFWENDVNIWIPMLIYLILGLIVSYKKDLSLQDLAFIMEMYMWVTIFYILLFISQLRSRLIDEIRANRDVTINISPKDLEECLEKLSKPKTDKL